MASFDPFQQPEIPVEGYPYHHAPAGPDTSNSTYPSPWPVRPGGWKMPLDRLGRPHPGLIWSFIWCILFLLFTQVPAALIAIVVVLFLLFVRPQLFPVEMGDVSGLMQSPGMSFAIFLALGVAQILVSAFSLVMLRLFAGKYWMRKVGFRLPKWWHVLLVLAGFLPLVLMANLGFQFFKSVIPHGSPEKAITGMEEMIHLFNSWPWPLAILIVGVGPGIGEELWCRGFLGRGLVGHYGVLGGVILTSFFFGLIHVDPVQGSMAMLMGLWLHFTYLVTRSLLVPMLLHFLNNSLAVVSSHFGFMELLDRPLALFSPSLILSSVVLISAVAYALYESRVRTVDFPGQKTLGGLGVEHPPSPLELWEESHAVYPNHEHSQPWSLIYPGPSLRSVFLVCLALLVYVLCFAWGIINL